MHGVAPRWSFPASIGYACGGSPRYDMLSASDVHKHHKFVQKGWFKGVIFSQWPINCCWALIWNAGTRLPVDDKILKVPRRLHTRYKGWIMLCMPLNIVQDFHLWNKPKTLTYSYVIIMQDETSLTSADLYYFVMFCSSICFWEDGIKG